MWLKGDHNNKQNISKIRCFQWQADDMELSTHIRGKWKIVWGNCVFIANSVGRLVSAVSAVYFHLQLGGNKRVLHRPLWTVFGIREIVFWNCFFFFCFHFTAVVTDRDFMQTSLIVFVSLLLFSLQILFQSRCNFANQYVNFVSFSSSFEKCVPFKNDLLPNWY